MKRRNFIYTAALSFPFFAFSKKMNLPELPSSAKEINPKEGFVIKAGENRFNETTKLDGKNPVDIKVSASDTEGGLTISEYTGYTKGGPPLHIHPHEDEVFIVLEGEHLFQMADKRYHLTTGDTIFIPRNVPHAHCQISEKVKLLFFFTPAGKTENFFREVNKAEVAGQPTPELMDDIFTRHGMIIVGPPLEY